MYVYEPYMTLIYRDPRILPSYFVPFGFHKVTYFLLYILAFPDETSLTYENG